MEVRFKLNGKQVSAEVSGDTILLDVLRNLGCYSVKCGCETTNCGLCTVWINGKSRLSCSILAAGIEGQEVTTLEGLKEEAEEFGAFLAQEGAEQCGFCSPGFIMNVLAMVRELENPTIEDYNEFLESRCFPRTRDKMKLVLRDLGIPFYDPYLIIQKTEGRMAEDDFWLKIER